MFWIFVPHRYTPQIDPSDVEVFAVAIVALGGQWRQGLTLDVTHLFAVGSTSDKYLTATHFQKQTHVMIVTPQWFDDVVRLGIPAIPTLPYEWPDPEVIDVVPSFQEGDQSHELLEEGRIIDNLGETVEHVNVWKGKLILLSINLGLNPGRREAVVAGVKRYGGVVVNIKDVGDEEEKAGEADVLITKFRTGAGYFEVFSPPH